MILLKISNASEIVASKVGGFIEELTPDSIDYSIVEDQVVKEMNKNLGGEGLTAEISAVNGIEVDDAKLIVSEKLKVRSLHKF